MTRLLDGLDYPRVFLDPNEPERRLWFIEDGGDWSALPAGTLPHVRELLDRCLAKDAKKRIVREVSVRGRQTTPTRQEDIRASAVRQRSFVGTHFFDDVARAMADGQLSTTALEGSTEEQPF